MEDYSLDSTTKECTKCKKTLTLRSFSKHNTARYGRNSVCKTCEALRVGIWQKNNPERVKVNQNKCSQKPKTKKYRRNWALKKHYGISLDRYNEMLSQQNGCCAICRVSTSLHVDHNHRTSKVRGLLCGDCNRGLGLFKDNTESLSTAIQYLVGAESADH